MGLRDILLIEAIYAAARAGRAVKLAADGRMRARGCREFLQRSILLAVPTN